MAPIGGAAVFATLLMNDAYLPGAMVLGHSLKDRGAKAPLVAFILVDKLSSDTINELRTVYDQVVAVQQINNRNPANLYLMNRPDLISTFTKIELWRQTQYKRIVYLDADMVVLRAPNELLTLDTDFAAVTDIGWPDCFNSGMLVLNPNMSDYYALYALAQRGISFDGADQGLLNMHFREWERLSFIYNCTPSGHYQYVPAYRHFQSSISAVHFIGADKPWTLGRDNKLSNGTYGELLGMWWSVYDKHYRPKAINYYDAKSFGNKRTVQDYVRGEEALYVVDHPPQQQAPAEQYHHQEPSEQSGQIPLPPEIHVHDTHSGQSTKVELPLGDAPTPNAPQDFHPVPTAQQRRFSAPHAEWDPARAPPPAHSKPEAANFPTTTYDMSSETSLFQPPAHYPEAPKDMWYEVPQKAPEPTTPRHIFPWESRAPKPTRVFPQAREPSPPPPLPPSIGPVGPDEEPSASTSSDVEAPSKEEEPISPPRSPPEPANVWDSFTQRTNAWDDMPEIERYVQAITQPRKGKIQVLYNTLGQRSPRSTSGSTTPTDKSRRRPSMKLTDFPTKDERPSLPVTPAPIRRGTLWGSEKDEPEQGTLPTAEGVPKQEEWVRRFSHYPQPEFPHSRPPPHDLPRVLSWRCQYCGQQNPITKLEELQRRQSEAMLSPEGTRELEDVPQPPTRKMPESSSKEEAVEATISHLSPTRVPKVPPKPILKTPHFELGQEHVPSPTQKPTETAQDSEADRLDPLSNLGDGDGAEDSALPLTRETTLEHNLNVRSTSPFLATTKA
ncbi:glycogenin glucosyltransferase [Cladophialophora chaetospira]|uniref:glycogenin glucosyltransferase n=1 Tax=Cladophialophora chaetospira TaxID=386627 RepID=A0AA38XDN0_9EURO|nr:glycogenin glucosyltransferase [Cladophialophora chaetospira]